MSSVVWICCHCKWETASVPQVTTCRICYHKYCDSCLEELLGVCIIGGDSGGVSGYKNTKTRLQPPTTDSYLSDRSREDGNGKIWKRLEEDLAKTCADAKYEQERMRQRMTPSNAKGDEFGKKTQNNGVTDSPFPHRPCRTSERVLSQLRPDASHSYKVSFEIHWDLVEFMRNQYDDYKNVFLSSVITITGTAIFAQATTCGQYVRQRWPLKGDAVLEVLQEALRHYTHLSTCRMSFDSINSTQ